MAFRDLDEFPPVEPLVLPIKGKTYSFPGEISARSWLTLQSMSGLAAKVQQGEPLDPSDQEFSGSDATALIAEMVGGVDKELAKDGLGSNALKLVFGTLVIFHLQGREMAEQFWNARGESLAPSRVTRRQQGRAKK